MTADRRLTRAELADEAQTTEERVEELVRIGAIAPDEAGLFEPADAQRVDIVEAYEDAGIGLDLIALAIERRWFALDRSELVYPDRGPRSRRTFGEFRASLGDRATQLGPLLAALGLPAPDDDARLTVRDEQRIASFLDAWSLSDDPSVGIRAARSAGESMRRLVEAWLELFAEQVTRPLADRIRTADELQPIVLPRAAAIIDQSPDFLSWLWHRHLESGLHEENITSMETGLAREGIIPARRPHPAAISFVDLAGYTRLTLESGDERAARVATDLAELAGDAARRHGGRLVKLLGDGAMLHFQSALAAVAATLELVAAVAAAGLPAAHAGIHVGPVVARDGDFFGHTVNLAARLSSAAGAGEVLVTGETVAEASPTGPRLRFEPAGERQLRNLDRPISVLRAIADR